MVESMRLLLLGAALGIVSAACHSRATIANAGASSRTGPGVPADHECEIYRLALAALFPDSLDKRPVLMDSTFNRVYQPAFNAWTGMRAPTTGPGSSIVSVTLDSLVAANRERIPLPTCLTAASYAVVATDTLKSIFSGPTRRTGWDVFYARHAGAAGFTGLSRVSFNSDSTEAIMYVGHHAHWLNGRGDVLRLQRIGARWTVTDRRVVWRS